jgi:PAS domain S-box-containing protein
VTLDQTAIPGAVADERRLAALKSYDILDTPPEAGFDDIVQLATQLCQTPIALVSLVAADRQWFKARVGFASCETDLNSSVCALVLTEPDVLVIPDLTADPRTKANPLVTGEPHIRFYAGAPLRTSEGQVIGSLCVIDNEPRLSGLTEVQARSLKALARQVMSQLELNRAVAGRDGLLAEQAAVQRTRDTLYRTQTAISETGGDLDAILKILVAGAMEAMPEADGGAIELAVGNELEYRAVAGTLAAFQAKRVPLEGSLSGACFQSGKPLLVSDVQVDMRVNQLRAERMKLRSCVVVPVLRGRRSIGVLKLQSSRPEAFTERHLQAARLFAGAASAGLIEVREAAAQRAVQASESQYRAIFESATDYAIVVMDLDGMVTNWNVGATRILGWIPEEVRGKPADVFFTPEDRAAGIPEQEMHSALTEDRGIDERWHLRKDGSRFWASGEMMALRDEDGGAIGFVKILRDRTEQRRSGEALREAALRLQQAQRAGGVGVFSIGIADGILRPSPEFCRLYGLPEADAYPSTAFEQLVIPEDRHLISTAGSRRSGEAPLDVEYRIVRPDTGEVRWIARKGEIEHDQAGRPVRFAGVARDITEQRADREALRISQERLNLAFEAAGAVGWWDWDIQNDRIVANARFAELYSVDPAEAAVGTSIARYIDGIHPQDREWVSARIEHALATGGEFAEEYRLLQANGSVRWVYARGRCYHDAAGRPQRYPGVSIDITARKLEGLRQAALVTLGDRLRDGTNIQEMTMAAAEIVGETLGVSRAGFGRLNHSGEIVTLERDWTAEGQASIAGPHRFTNYGNLREGLLDGHPVVIGDVRTDPRTATDGRPLAALDIRALINMPVRERGRTTALFFVHDRQVRTWQPEEVAFLRTAADRVEAAVARIHAEEQQELINRELSHRLKNTLAMVQAIVTQTLRNATDVDTAKETVAARLIALSKAHDILLVGQGESAEISAIVAGALQLHDDEQKVRFRLDGPPLRIHEKGALSLSLMMHELATNAAKYGALSTPDGMVHVTWVVEDIADVQTVRLTWRESGGPSVVVPSRKGFGSRLIERGLAGDVGGTVRLSYPADGVVCELIAPLAGFQPVV